jgi:hypothetical protein
MYSLPKLAAPWLVAILALASPLRPASSEPLPALGADLSRTTVSGLSSGAYMAGQFQVAYSRLVIGAGIVAGGPYGCARTPGTELNPFWPVVLSWNSYRAQNQCMQDGWFFSSVPDAGGLVQYAEREAQDGRIDPLDALRADKVYIFSSSKDDTVRHSVVEVAVAFYRKAGVPDANISFVTNDRAAHSFLTETEGLACGKTGPPYLNDCDYDQAKAVLEELYGTLVQARPAVDTSYLHFEQAPFASGLDEIYFDATGIAYIPLDCRTNAGCAVHVVFHGCKQDLAAVGEQFVKGAGFARWAESNRIILLFPQVKPGDLNPNGCWDWWGYTGPHFLERDAPQMLAVKHMIDRLASAP